MPFRVGDFEYYSTSEAAKQLGLNRRTLLSLIRRGVLPDVKKQRYVTRAQRGFTPQWIEAAREILSRH